MPAAWEAWEAARAELAAVLAAVELENGTVAAAVHQLPVAAIPPRETPTWIMALPEVTTEITAGWRASRYTLDCGLFVQTERIEEAAAQLDRYREAVIVGCANAITLHGEATYLLSPEVLPANAEIFAGITYPHMTFRFEIQLEGPLETGP